MLRVQITFGDAIAVSAAGWRRSFYFNLTITGIKFQVFFFTLPFRKSPASSACPWARACRIDIPGALLFVDARCSEIMAISFGGPFYHLNSGAIVGLLCYSGVLWLLFGIQGPTATFTTKADRILPLHILNWWGKWILIIQIGSSICMLFITILYPAILSLCTRVDDSISSWPSSISFHHNFCNADFWTPDNKL